jgi:hypothetical protein
MYQGGVVEGQLFSSGINAHLGGKVVDVVGVALDGKPNADLMGLIQDSSDQVEIALDAQGKTLGRAEGETAPGRVLLDVGQGKALLGLEGKLEGKGPEGKAQFFTDVINPAPERSRQDSSEAATKHGGVLLNEEDLSEGARGRPLMQGPHGKGGMDGDGLSEEVLQKGRMPPEHTAKEDQVRLAGAGHKEGGLKKEGSGFLNQSELERLLKEAVNSSTAGKSEGGGASGQRPAVSSSAKVISHALEFNEGGRKFAAHEQAPAANKGAAEGASSGNALLSGTDPRPLSNGVSRTGEASRAALFHWPKDVAFKGLNSISLMVDTPELGELHMSIHMRGQHIKAHFLTPGVPEKNVMEEHMPLLREHLINHGLSVQDLTVEARERGQSFAFLNRDLQGRGDVESPAEEAPPEKHARRVVHPLGSILDLRI